MRELDFSPGTIVEVNIDLDNSPDVWFPATFIQKLTNDSFLVEYRSSQEAGLQEVAVDLGRIRPSPPQSRKKGFSLLDKVDAFHDFCWLSGVVTKILADRRYIVYFKRTKKEKELSHADVRLHLEWTSGKWVNSSKDTSLTSASRKQMDSTVNDGHKEKTCTPTGSAGTNEHVSPEENLTGILKISRKLPRTPDSEKTDNKSTTPNNKIIKESSGDVVNTRQKSSRRMTEKNESDCSPLSPESCKDALHNGELAVDSSPIGITEKSSSKPSEDSNQSSNPTGKMGDNEQHTVRRKRGRPPMREKPLKLQALEKSVASANREKSPKLQSLEQDAVEQAPNKSGDVFPHGSIVMGLMHTCKKTKTVVSTKVMEDEEEHNNTEVNPESVVTRTCKTTKTAASSKVMEDQEKHSNTEVKHESVGSERHKDSEVTTPKRKRGRPFKVVEVTTLKKKRGRPFKDAEVTTMKKKRGRPFKVLSRIGRSKSKEAEHALMESKDYVSDTKETIKEVGNPVIVSESAGISSPNPSSRVSRRRRRKMNSNRECNPSSSEMVLKKVQKSTEEMATVSEPVTLGRIRRQKPVKQVELPTEGSGDHLSEKGAKVLDNGVSGAVQTLAGTLSNVSDDDRPLSAWFEGEDKKTNQKDDAVEREDQAIVPVKNQEELPFVKTSLIWSMIESMEVIKRIPQNPHFHPLYNSKEECREGLAIGHMVTFTSLVDRICRLQFDDPESAFDGYFESLAELEEQGFNVGPVRDRLIELMSIKGRYEQMVELDDEKSKIDEEVEEIEKKIEELSEKRGLAMTKRETKNAQIRLLKSNMDTAKACLESSKEEFEKIATSRWC